MLARKSRGFCDSELLDVSKGVLQKEPWPSDSIGERTVERISAGKRAGKFIACDLAAVGPNMVPARCA